MNDEHYLFPVLVKNFRFPLLLLALLATTSAHAFLGDTLDQIVKYRGKPSGKPDKGKAIWLFEGTDGQMAFAVRFDAQGKSIAETLKPALVGRSLHEHIVGDFIKAHTERLKDSKTLVKLEFGQKYTFAGRQLAVAENEHVEVDDANGFLLVWVRGSMPSVTVISPAALQ